MTKKPPKVLYLIENDGVGEGWIDDPEVAKELEAQADFIKSHKYVKAGSLVTEMDLANFLHRKPIADQFGGTSCIQKDDAINLAKSISEGFSIEKDEWLPIDQAPKDGTLVLVYCPQEFTDASLKPLPEFITITAYHESAGWCVCSIRKVTHFRYLPKPPEGVE